MQRNILVIEGDSRLHDATVKALDADGFVCADVRDLPEAQERIQQERFDLALLDASAFDPDNPEQVTRLRDMGQLPLVAIAPRADARCAVQLLNAGAADYLTEPFNVQDLRERIEVQLLRRDEAQACHLLRYRDLSLDPENFTVTVQRQPLSLTRQEFKILELMLSYPPGRIFSKQDFFDYAWGGNYAVVDKTVNVHICNIRKKLKVITDDEYIETIWGFGFRLA